MTAIYATPAPVVSIAYVTSAVLGAQRNDFSGWVGMAIGAWQGGLFFDLNGDYTQSFLNSSIAGVVNLMLLGLLYLYTDPRRMRGRRGLAAA